jgi:hypothetical protein
VSAHASAGQAPRTPRGCPLLVVIDPVARTLDGESVRIAKDVLRAGADSLKICLPESLADWERALLHRGRRRPVVVGDDPALLRTLRILHREGAADQATVSFVPVGTRPGPGLAKLFGVPQSAVSAARAALDGVERALDLLVDDSGGIVVGALRIPGAGPPAVPAQPDSRHWLAGARSLVRTLTGPGVAERVHHAAHRLRVEADGRLLADPAHPVHEVSVLRPPSGGRAEVHIRHPHGSAPLPVHARQLTVSGPDFRYRADDAVTGPVPTRTWTVAPAAWTLMLPH